MELALDPDPERVWKGFDPKVRNQVRKGEKSGLTVETVVGNDIAEFYDVYSHNMRDLGSPPHSRQFFQSVKDSFADDAQIHLARFEGRVVGGGMTIRNGSRLDIPWASSLHDFNRLCVNHALYWHMIRGASVAGCQSFYFGRSTRGSGPHHFKKQWGATEVPLYWYRLDVDGSPQVDNRPPQESFGLAIRLWKKLPVGIARRLGPWLISQLD
ncbi:MAG: GNAT family N-acetyltransferase, partial [Planctomycetota bacterium]|nr:GNAT family N-acetyltransferase [Planctomycetota bacterium]